MNTYTLGSTSLICSLNSQTIYIQATTEQYKTYETTCDTRDLGLDCSLEEAYALINNCFVGKSDHSVVLNLDKGRMDIRFTAKLGGYFKVECSAILCETENNGGGDTESFGVAIRALEQKYKELLKTQIDEIDAKYRNEIDSMKELLKNQMDEIDTLTRRLSELITPQIKKLNELENTMISGFEQVKDVIDILQHAEITIGYNNNGFGSIPIRFPINSGKINISFHPTHTNIEYNNFQLFVLLQSFELTGQMGVDNFIRIQNGNVRHLILSLHIVGECRVNLMEQFPKLEKITVAGYCKSVKMLLETLISKPHTINTIVMRHGVQQEPDYQVLKVVCSQINTVVIYE